MYKVEVSCDLDTCSWTHHYPSQIPLALYPSILHIGDTLGMSIGCRTGFPRKCGTVLLGHRRKKCCNSSLNISLEERKVWLMGLLLKHATQVLPANPIEFPLPEPDAIRRCVRMVHGRTRSRTI